MFVGDTPRQVWGHDHLRLAVDAACVSLWSWNLAHDRFAMDERAFQLWGLPWAEAVSFENLSAHIHPADRDRVHAAFSATRSAPGPYEIDFRIMVADDIRWISARGRAAEAGAEDGPMFGIFLDVTGRKQAEEGSELLAGEMSHRVKNLLAIAAGLTELTSRSAVSVEEMTRQLTQRLTSLGRAHDLVRPLPGEQGKAALLGDLLAILLSPYEDTGAFAGRIRVAVPRMGVGEATATTLAMVVHELATNSVKHGALSTSAGTLDVSGRTEEDEVYLIWSETGGPEVLEAPEMSGFGSRMIVRSVTTQLGGSLSYDWQPAGLVATLTAQGPNGALKSTQVATESATWQCSDSRRPSPGGARACTDIVSSREGKDVPIATPPVPAALAPMPMRWLPSRRRGRHCRPRLRQARSQRRRCRPQWWGGHDGATRENRSIAKGCRSALIEDSIEMAISRRKGR